MIFLKKFHPIPWWVMDPLKPVISPRALEAPGASEWIKKLMASRSLSNTVLYSSETVLLYGIFIWLVYDLVVISLDNLSENNLTVSDRC